MHFLCFNFKFYEVCLKISEKRKDVNNLDGIFKRKERKWRAASHAFRCAFAELSQFHTIMV